MTRMTALCVLTLAVLMSTLWTTHAATTQPSPANLEIGQPAPAVNLPNQDEQPVRLEDYRGKWVVLYFYPKDDTSGCTTEACEFTERLDEFGRISAVVLGVSPDSTESHRQFIRKHNLKLTLLSDPDRQVMRTYGAWIEKDGQGRTVRSTVLIDPQGRIAYRWPTVNPAGHAQAVQAKLEELAKSN